VRLARSRDFGKTWRQSLVVETKDATAFFPYLIARGNGELAATWFAAKMPGWGSLRLHVARFHVSDDGNPQNVHTVAFAIDVVSTQKEPPTAGEYIPLAFLRNGRLAVATPIQDRVAKRIGFSYWVVAD
jgi:hypothetical protein